MDSIVPCPTQVAVVRSGYTATDGVCGTNPVDTCVAKIARGQDRPPRDPLLPPPAWRARPHRGLRHPDRHRVILRVILDTRWSSSTSIGCISGWRYRHRSGGRQQLRSTRAWPRSPTIGRRLLDGAAWGDDDRGRMAALLRWIAGDVVPHRPGRSEPRRVKRRPKNYSKLTMPRAHYHKHGDNLCR